MSEKIQALMESVRNFKTVDPDINIRQEKRNWRLNQAIDILLDHILKLERRSKAVDEYTEDRFAEGSD